MRRPAVAGAGALAGVATLVMVVAPAPAPSTVLMTPWYRFRSVALLANSSAVAPAGSTKCR